MIKRPQKDVRQYCKREPRQHQLRIWRDTRDDEFSGFHLHMGTGKSKITIDTVSYLFLNKKICHREILFCKKTLCTLWRIIVFK